MPLNPSTVIITRRVRARNESGFEDAVKAIIPKAVDFPGRLGVHMLLPSPGERELRRLIGPLAIREAFS